MEQGAGSVLTVRGLVVALLLSLAVCGLAATGARAGVWTLDSCTQPNGQPAPIDGWVSGWFDGSQTGGSGDIDGCAQGGSLAAVAAGYGVNGAGPQWTFTAPAGTTIAGGVVDATISAANGESWMATPDNSNQATDDFAYCAFNSECGPNYTQTASFGILHAGGTSIYAVARCLDSSGTCPSTDGVNAEVEIHSAEIELDDAALPTGSGFSGPVLDRPASGVADLLFTAADPNEPSAADPSPGYGPGVYAVTVLIDGTTAYSGTPNTNGGACVPVGAAPAGGGLMFDLAQPCQALESVDVPVNTSLVTDGSHDLKVVVTDAAGNSATVLDQEITTSNPVVTPVPGRRGEVRARLITKWHWNGARTRLDSITGRSVPANGRITVRCQGHGCPRLRMTRASGRLAAKLWHALLGRAFTANDRLQVTIAAPRRRAERIEFDIRNNQLPLARLL